MCVCTRACVHTLMHELSCVITVISVMTDSSQRTSCGSWLSPFTTCVLEGHHNWWLAPLFAEPSHQPCASLLWTAYACDLRFWSSEGPLFLFLFPQEGDFFLMASELSPLFLSWTLPCVFLSRSVSSGKQRRWLVALSIHSRHIYQGPI